MFKSGALLTLGNLGSAVLLMVRNIVIARLISVEDMGVAATFAITMAVLEMMTDFALNQMLIQDREGDTPRVKGTLQLMQFLRGLLAGIILYLIAGPYARILGVPDIAWAFQIMGLIPVIRGLAHLDVFQSQRQLNYKPFVSSIVISQAVSLLAVWPMVALTGDFRAMLYVLLIQHTLYAVITHLVATNRFAFVWDKEVFFKGLNFGWPLLLNGVLMFLILCGDRVIVANLMTMTDLGLFAMAFTMAMNPTLVLGKTLQPFFLPQLSRVQDDDAAFRKLYPTVLEAYMLAGAAFAVGIAILGPPVFVLLLGEKYTPALPLLIWLAMSQGLRLCKGGPAIVALSRAKTRNPMVANFVRLAGLPVAWVAVQMTGNVLAVAFVALAAEAASLAVSLIVLRRALDIPLRPVLPVLIAMGVVLALIGLDASWVTPRPGFLDHPHLFQLVILGGFAAMLACATHARGWLMERLRGR